MREGNLLDIDLAQKLNLLRTILEIAEGKEKAAIEGEIAYLETHLEVRT